MKRFVAFASVCTTALLALMGFVLVSNGASKEMTVLSHAGGAGKKDLLLGKGNPPNLEKVVASVVGSKEKTLSQVRTKIAASHSSDVKPLSADYLSREQYQAVSAVLDAFVEATYAPNRDEIRNAVLDEILDKYDGQHAAETILTHLDETLRAFGESQAKCRFLAIKTLERAAARGLLDDDGLSEIMGVLAQSLQERPQWSKGVEFDYRDVLWLYLERVGWEKIESNPASFRSLIGFNPKLAPLVRKTLLSFFDSKIPENRLYPVLRKVGEGA